MAPPTHNRKSMRLKEYDYSRAGAYFVTVCTHDKKCLFGHIANEQMILNESGWIVYRQWVESSNIRSEICLDKFIIMPNHMHGIVWITKI